MSAAHVKIYAIVPTNWDYDDEWYSAEGYGKPTEAYHDKGKAEVRAAELNAGSASKHHISREDISEYDRHRPFYNVVEVGCVDLVALEKADAAAAAATESPYEKARRLKREAKEQARALALSAFKEGAKALFDKHPLLTSFTFRCYTPYFNDGDTCRYGVHADEPNVNGEYWEECDLVSSGEKWDSKERKYVKTGEPGALYEAWSADIPKFVYSFDKDDVEAMFGDHTEVTVKYDRAAGTVAIEQDEYSHD